MKQPVVIFGTTEFAEVASVYLTKDSPYEVAAFTVDSRYITAPTLLGVPVVPFEQIVETHPPDRYGMFVAIGFKRLNRLRTEMYDRCKSHGYRMVSYVCSKAIHWGDLEVGDNCFVFEANVLQPFVRIGNNVIVWCGNHIGHHVTIGDNCFIASHAVISGKVTIGHDCFIGVNATLRDGITVAPRCIIGAGALVLRDTAEGEVYAASRTKPGTLTSEQLTNF